MKSYSQFVFYAVLAIFTLAFFGFIADGLGLISFGFFAPKIEQVRYNTFKQSQSYNDGMVRDLENLKMAYLQGNAEQKAALLAIVLHRFSVYSGQLPPDLEAFYASLTH